MKKLIVLILVAAAAWYGWKHWPDLLARAPGHSAVVENESGHPIERLRFTADGVTQVAETLAPGASANFTFKVANDTELELTWEWGDKLGERHWKGGLAAKGPVLARHTMTIDDDGEVLYRAEAKSAQ
jgi:hypothetical protein